MKKFICLILLFANFYFAQGGSHCYCDIEGINNKWKYDYMMPQLINDSHTGSIGTFNTEGISEMKDSNSKYLEATFKNDILTISTNDDFKNYSPIKDGKSVNIKLLFSCNGKKGKSCSQSIVIKQLVRDPNYKGPFLNQQAYEYNFTMPIPENYDLTKFTKIFVSDVYSVYSTFSSYDFENSVYFSLDFNEQFTTTYNGKKERDGNYYTSLKALKEIKGPFQQSYNIHVKDRFGLNTKGTVKINVLSNGNEDTQIPSTPHPPVFQKHVYFANYTGTTVLNIEDTIAIKYEATPKTVISQSGYQNYFRITLDESNYKHIKVNVIQPLPQEILKTFKLLVIEIKAINEGITIPGKTALVIRTYTGYGINGTIEQNKSYTCVASYNYAPTILLSIALFSIITINLVIIGGYLRRNIVKEINTSN